MLQQIAVAATVVLHACPGMPEGDISQPETWGQYYLDKYEVERRIPSPLEAGPRRLEVPRTVLLITGVTIPAEWFDPIVARLERDGFKPVLYEPPALLSGDLFENSVALAGVVDRVRRESGQDKIDILAECTGGLIARYYLQELGGDAYVNRMVTFISPQHGVAKAPLAASLVGWPALDDLSPGSDFLAAVNDAPLPARSKLTSIYTCTDEYIQPYQTSIIPGATNIGLCDGFVGHYQFFYDPAIYLVMHGALTETVFGDDPFAPPVTPEAPADPDEPELGDDAGGCSAGRGAGASVGVLLLAALALSTRRRARISARGLTPGA